MPRTSDSVAASFRGACRVGFSQRTEAVGGDILQVGAHAHLSLHVCQRTAVRLDCCLTLPAWAFSLWGYSTAGCALGQSMDNCLHTAVAWEVCVALCDWAVSCAGTFRSWGQRPAGLIPVCPTRSVSGNKAPRCLLEPQGYASVGICSPGRYSAGDSKVSQVSQMTKVRLAQQHQSMKSY